MSGENIDPASTELPWPKLGDVLYQEGEEECHNARVDWGEDRWEIYATGYKSAADILADSGTCS